MASLCQAMDIETINVSGAFARTPPDQARTQILQSVGVLALAVRRDKQDDGSWAMPAAVREEIAIAFALHKPVLLLFEDGVRIDGFMNNYGTHVTFRRDEVRDTGVLQTLVKSIFTFRAELQGTTSAASHQFVSEQTSAVFALERENGRYVWVTGVTYRLRFSEPLNHDLVSRVWPGFEIRHPPEAPPLQWRVYAGQSSKPFQLTATVKSLNANSVDLSIAVSPAPQPGDILTFTRVARSPYINPVTMADLVDPDVSAIQIGGRSYPAHEGLLIVEPTAQLHLSLRFPFGYPLRISDVQPFAASHARGIDHISEAELRRTAVTIEDVAGYVSADLRVQEPLINHMYGVAWQPPTAVPDVVNQ